MAGFVFFDIDNTIYNGYITSDFYLFLTEQGLFLPEVYEAEHNIVKAFEERTINYAEATRRAIEITAKYLKGKTVARLSFYQQAFLQNQVSLFSWVDDVFQLLREREFEPVLVSAAAEPAVSIIAEKLGISSYYATPIDAKKGVFTGKFGKIINYDEKRQVIFHHTQSYPNAMKIGVGDSEGDLPMLSLMDKALLYSPRSQAVIQQAKQSGFLVVDEKSIYPTIEKLLISQRSPFF